MARPEVVKAPSCAPLLGNAVQVKEASYEICDWGPTVALRVRWQRVKRVIPEEEKHERDQAAQEKDGEENGSAFRCQVLLLYGGPHADQGQDEYHGDEDVAPDNEWPTSILERNVWIATTKEYNRDAPVV